MKTLLTALLISFTLTSFSQMVGFQIDNQGNYYYEKTFKVDSTSSNELIIRVKYGFMKFLVDMKL